MSVARRTRPPGGLALLGGLALAGLLAVTSLAQAAILGIQNNSSVYSIDETSGAATLLSTNATNANAMARSAAGVYYTAGGLGNGVLSTINPVTGQLTAGPNITGAGDVRALAFSPTDVLYAIDSNNGGRLYTIDPATGVGTLVGQSGIWQALAFSPSGVLYAWNATVGLATIDPATGVATDVNVTVGSTGDIQTIAFSSGGVAYGGASSLYTIDLTTGVLTLVGSLAPATDIRGMEFLAAAPPAPGVSLTPSPLAFPGQQVATTSIAQPVTLQNTGGATLNIASIAASGDFAQTNTCGATLAAGASCTISVTFTPTALGARAGSIVVTSNATGSPHSAALTGTGLAAPGPAAVSLTPGSLTFGPQLVGTTSPTQPLTLQNTGGTTLNIALLTSTGDFFQSNTCGATLAPGASCTISVSFVPSAAGLRTGSIAITSDASGSPHSALLSGTGTVVTPPLPPSPGASIPTLSEWGVILLVALVALVALGGRTSASRRR